jgi:hypothetical protein
MVLMASKPDKTIKIGGECLDGLIPQMAETLALP